MCILIYSHVMSLYVHVAMTWLDCECATTLQCSDLFGD